MRRFLLLTLLLAHRLTGQNLLVDIPSTLKANRDTCDYLGFETNESEKSIYSWSSLSQLRYGGSYCNNFLTNFYFKLYAKKGISDYLQILLKEPLKKDSMYRLELYIEPRYQKKPYKFHGLKFCFLDSVEYGHINQIPANAMFSQLTEIANEKLFYIIPYKANGNEKVLLIQAGNLKKGETIFNLSKLCLHQLNTNCDADYVKYIPAIAVTQNKNDTISIYFDNNKSTFNEAAEKALRNLKYNEDELTAIICTGYADSTGNLNYNMNLSLQRAAAVKKYLKSLYPSLTITANAAGVGTNKQSLTANRRVDIVIVKRAP